MCSPLQVLRLVLSGCFALSRWRFALVHVSVLRRMWGKCDRLIPSIEVEDSVVNSRKSVPRLILAAIRYDVNGALGWVYVGVRPNGRTFLSVRPAHGGQE